MKITAKSSLLTLEWIIFLLVTPQHQVLYHLINLRYYQIPTVQEQTRMRLQTVEAQPARNDRVLALPSRGNQPGDVRHQRLHESPVLVPHGGRTHRVDRPLVRRHHLHGVRFSNSGCKQHTLPECVVRRPAHFRPLQFPQTCSTATKHGEHVVTKEALNNCSILFCQIVAKSC